jgi:hypothetical protein
MAATLPRRSFLDHPVSRLVALLIAVALAAAIWWSWSHQADRPMAVQPRQVEVPDSTDPALADCIRQRLAAVDDMRANNVIAADQVTEFKARAVTLCEQTTRPRP